MSFLESEKVEYLVCQINRLTLNINTDFVAIVFARKNYRYNFNLIVITEKL